MPLGASLLAASAAILPGASAQAEGASQPIFSTPESASAASADLRPAGGVDAEDSVDVHRLREGTHLNNRVGRFRLNGESLTFVDENDRAMGSLPNLNLERILRVLKAVDEPESIVWSVSGDVTEFSGRNFLLISRAVYKAAAAPPPPDSIKDDKADAAAPEK
jgi:hypothetical protein